MTIVWGMLIVAVASLATISVLNVSKMTHDQSVTPRLTGDLTTLKARMESIALQASSYACPPNQPTSSCEFTFDATNAIFRLPSMLSLGDSVTIQPTGTNGSFLLKGISPAPNYFSARIRYNGNRFIAANQDVKVRQPGVEMGAICPPGSPLFRGFLPPPAAPYTPDCRQPPAGCDPATASYLTEVDRKTLVPKCLSVAGTAITNNSSGFITKINFLGANKFNSDSAPRFDPFLYFKFRPHVQGAINPSCQGAACLDATDPVTPHSLIFENQNCSSLTYASVPPWNGQPPTANFNSNDAVSFSYVYLGNVPLTVKDTSDENVTGPGALSSSSDHHIVFSCSCPPPPADLKAAVSYANENDTNNLTDDGAGAICYNNQADIIYHYNPTQFPDGLISILPNASSSDTGNLSIYNNDNKFHCQKNSCTDILKCGYRVQWTPNEPSCPTASYSDYTMTWVPPTCTPPCSQTPLNKIKIALKVSSTIKNYGGFSSVWIQGPGGLHTGITTGTPYEFEFSGDSMPFTYTIEGVGADLFSHWELDGQSITDVSDANNGAGAITRTINKDVPVDPNKVHVLKAFGSPPAVQTGDTPTNLCWDNARHPSMPVTHLNGYTGLDTGLIFKETIPYVEIENAVTDYAKGNPTKQQKDVQNFRDSLAKIGITNPEAMIYYGAVKWSDNHGGAEEPKAVGIWDPTNKKWLCDLGETDGQGRHSSGNQVGNGNPPLMGDSERGCPSDENSTKFHDILENAYNAMRKHHKINSQAYEPDYNSCDHCRRPGKDTKCNPPTGTMPGGDCSPTTGVCN